MRPLFEAFPKEFPMAPRAWAAETEAQLAAKRPAATTATAA